MTTESGGGIKPLAVLTVFKKSDVFTEEYVTRLRDGVAANLSIPHKFYCLTDTPVSGVECLPLKTDYPGWWAKPEIFRTDLPFKRVLFIDLSSVVVGSLDDMAVQDGVVITRDFNTRTPSQSVLLYDVGDFSATWDAWINSPGYWMEKGDKRIAPDFGDQVLMNHTPVPRMSYWQDVLPGHLVSFKKNGVPEWARLVKFHGEPKPHDVNWLEQVEYHSTLNTAPARMLENAKANWARGHDRFIEMPSHKRAMNLVAGGPSLADNMMALRWLDGDTFALNGSHDYLLEFGIVPDYMVMLDARPENAVFVQNPREGVKYMISAVCDPAVFDALDDSDVTIWANFCDGMEAALPDAEVLIGGGATVGMKAMYLGYLMGYRTFRLFGFDSSYRKGENHAFRQPLNDGEKTVSVWTAGQEFICAPWMAKQAEEFKGQAAELSRRGCLVEVYGDGLIPAIAAQMGE